MNPLRKQLEAWAAEADVELIFFDDLDEAIMGLQSNYGENGGENGVEIRVLYDRLKCIPLLGGGEEGEEWFIQRRRRLPRSSYSCVLRSTPRTSVAPAHVVRILPFG